MKCEQSSEITAYLQGEGSEEERAMLRRHFDQCEACARELAQFERAFGALGNLATIDPSPDFQGRVQEAFLRAHPQFGRGATPRFRLLRAVTIAAGLLIAFGGPFLVWKMLPKDPEDRSKMANVTPDVTPDDDPEYRALPKTDLPAKIDASAWGEALAYDRRLIEAIRTPAENTAALKWLAARQEADGSWKGENAGETIELTGLALMALSRSDDQGLAVRKAVAFLRSRQRDSGAIGGGSPESHAIATLALQEVAIRTKDPAAIKTASKGVSMIAQQNATGPWGRGMVAGWHYHVLRLAVASGDRALTPLLARGHEALVALTDASEACASFWTSPSPGRELPRLLDRSPILGTEPANFSKNDLWLAYFGSTLLRPRGGDAWTKWWSPLQAKLLKAQAADGSWPAGFHPGKGQVYVTALCAIVLQTPGRVPPLDE